MFKPQKLLLFAMVATILTLTMRAHAELSNQSQTAVDETKRLLNNQKAVDDYAKKNPNAAQANENLKIVVGGDPGDQAAVYKLASDIFENMAQASNGDGAAMQAELTKAMKNPSAFANSLSPAQQAELKRIGQSVESRSPSSVPH